MENYLNDPKYSNKMLFNYYSILNEIQECGHTLDIAAITYENIYKARSVYKSPIVILFINDTIVYSHEYNTSIYHFYKNKYLSFEDNKLYVC